MKRLIAIFAVICAGVALIVVTAGAGDDGAYRVRAIFNNAAFVIPGMDVKVAGVRVGKIESLGLTPNHKAAVVLNIENPDYHDFRQDAFCRIRPQSLIGERYVDCKPEEPRPAGIAQPPLLKPLPSGPGKGQYLLPSTRTATSVDLDLINNVMRLPYRQRFTLILNEFGTALAGNGKALNAALKVSDPALKEFNDVLEILARQNKTLAALAVNGSTVLEPLARERAHVAGFINSAGYTAQATAEESAAMTQNLQKLPGFLTELSPTMVQLANFSKQATPVFTDLNSAADSLNSFTLGSPAFYNAGTPALESLGDTADVGGPALVNSLPLVEKLGPLSSNAKPTITNLAALLDSVRTTGGIDRLMELIYNVAGTSNGYDQFGHYTRAGLTTTICQAFFTVPDPSCIANFPASSSASASGSTARVPSSKQASAPNTAAPKQPTVPASGAPSTGAAAPHKGKQRQADPQSARALLDYLLGK
ncbi:MAG: MCE family protein [Actinobacteria bacterium]|uniref:Unannotated protein n=1 Tax=freshwater metagenome TaxID=449393 RepID=A0A6J5ZAH0_9ZZZZ|nr:MCE family protein [Actinomycetota bacterium]